MLLNRGRRCNRPYPKINEPAYLTHTLVLATECFGLSPEVWSIGFLCARAILTVVSQALAEATTANARRLFGLPVLPFDGALRTKPSQQAHSPNTITGVCRLPVKKPPPKPQPAKDGEKEAAGPEGGPAGEKKEKQVFYIYKGKKYACTTKEKAILLKQKKALDAAGFEKLFQDFDLKELGK